MTRCEQLESIILEAAQMASKHYSNAINAAVKEESRLEYLGNYAVTLSVLADAMNAVTPERSSGSC